jgi:hypothetical protein
MPGADALLLRSRQLVVDGWTQGADARAADGREVEPWAEDAAAWSLLGALVAALEEQQQPGSELPLEDLAVALHALAGFVDDDSLSAWNDTPRRTRAEVEAVLAAAAEEVAPQRPSAVSRDRSTGDRDCG